MKKLIIRPNGIEEVDLTAEEIAQAETNDANSQSKLQQEQADKTAKENNKTSAQNKLKALGLTDAEIEAL
tara:strand:- start:1044 stop:1253 length:210 start_codon:yes stop_codon:yes gene_type:complete